MTDVALTVVVLAWDQLAFTRRCVESLRARTTVPYELIIVDNGSAPPARRYAAEAADRAVLLDANLGFAAGMNRGLAVARGAHVVFLNNDTRVPARWAERLLETAAAHPRAGMVVPALTAAGNPRTVRQQPGDGVGLLNPFELPPSGVCVLMPTALARALGGWSERYEIASGEDADLAFTVWTNDLEIVFDQRVLIEHVGKVTAGTKLSDWRGVWRRNGARFLELWTDPSAPVPRLDDVPADRWERNRRTAAAAAGWMQAYFALQDRAHPVRRRARRLVAPVERLVRRLRARRGAAR